ncbi:hypothetical protein [Thalassotalea sp. G2M2-11]|uniref:hypothetical protein n=1 Tax=Thalassotalea sp. G2M2-11 TaxID=2787627 RepID=UPI0019D10D4C|nr:hypothetical protein [Thalassotalea sp. G2M2-11]
MFKKYVKPILLFNRSQAKAPNIILVYLLIWLLWHHRFFIDLFISQASVSERLHLALANNEHQYMMVLLLTGTFYGLRLLYLYFSQKADEIIEEDEPIESKIQNDQLFKENKDVIRLLELLEETKNKLAATRASEAQMKTEKIAAINRVRALQNELEEVKADLDIMVNSNAELTAKLKQNVTA